MPPDSNSLDLSKLRDVLAGLIQRETDIRRVAFDAGLNLAMIEFDPRAINTWLSLLKEAQDTGRLVEVIDQAKKLCPQNADLERASRAAVGPSALECLMQLNYTAQVRTFVGFARRQRIGAFLIHGETECGQGWLYATAHLSARARRLARRAYPIEPQIARTGQLCGLPLAAAQKRLTGHRISLDSSHHCRPATKVAHTARHLDRPRRELSWQGLPRRFVRDFWQPLCYAMKATPESYPLLLFLIAESDEVDDWGLPWPDCCDASWQPDTPIKLPALPARFTEDELREWLEREELAGRLPMALASQG